MDAGGAHVRRLTGGKTGDVTPSHGGPDGKLIAFGECCYDGPQSALVPTIDVVRPDGGGRRVLFRGDFYDFANPTWSPDGRRIVFDDGSDVLRVMDAHGSGMRPFFAGSAGRGRRSASGRRTGGTSRSSPPAAPP